MGVGTYPQVFREVLPPGYRSIGHFVLAVDERARSGLPFGRVRRAQRP